MTQESMQQIKWEARWALPPDSAANVSAVDPGEVLREDVIKPLGLQKSAD